MNANSTETKDKSKTTLKGKFWPSVSTPGEARYAARQGMWAAYIGGGLSLFAIVAAFFSSDVREFLGEILEVTLEALLFIGLGFAIGKMSRVAAVFALILFLLDKIIMPPANAAGIIFALAFLWLYALGIKGTFAWHRLAHK